MYNQTFVKAFQISDLFSPVANPVSVPESELLARNSRVIWVVIAAMSIATIVGCDPMFLSASPQKVSRSSCSF